MSKNNSKKGFERKLKKDGLTNKKYVDLLEVDKPIAGQTFGCFSFISPETILKQREMYYFDEFLKQWEMNKSMEKFHQFLNFLSFKYKLQFEEVIKSQYQSLIFNDGFTFGECTNTDQGINQIVLVNFEESVRTLSYDLTLIAERLGVVAATEIAMADEVAT